MTKNIKRVVTIILLLLIIIVGVLLMTGNIKFPVNDNSTLNLLYEIEVSAALSEMADASQVIVVGQYKGYDSSWNMARNPNNVLEEDSENYTEGHFYEFSIDEVLKGDVDEREILVNHRYSEIVKTTDPNTEFTLIDPLYIAPEYGVSYILFLTKEEIFGNYYGSIEPFSIKIESDNTVTLNSNLIDSTGSFEDTVTLDDGRMITVLVSKGSCIEDNISNNTLESIKQQIYSSAKSKS